MVHRKLRSFTPMPVSAVDSPGPHAPHLFMRRAATPVRVQLEYLRGSLEAWRGPAAQAQREHSSGDSTTAVTKRSGCCGGGCRVRCGRWPPRPSDVRAVDRRWTQPNWPTRCGSSCTDDQVAPGEPAPLLRGGRPGNHAGARGPGTSPRRGPPRRWRAAAAAGTRAG